MPITLEIIQSLAPEQASSNAAKKLLSPAKWPMRESADNIDMIWGQCKGSGSNPYFTMANSADHGYKCTCPSRKFPCKHVIALMWMFSDDATAFTPTEQIPTWVSDWMSRRRGPKPSVDGANQDDTAAQKKNIHDTETTPPPIDPAALAKKAAAQEKRKQQNRHNTIDRVNAGLVELQRWIEDQLKRDWLPSYRN